MPLLRFADWDPNKRYDKNNPVCIHYNFRWKVSQRENVRARHVFSDTDYDIVLAPSDHREIELETRLEDLLQDKDKFPGDAYMCDETIIEISIERSRQRGLSKRYKKQDVDWDVLDEHIEGLGDLFKRGRKVNLSMELVYKEVLTAATTVKGKAKGKSASETQKLQRLAEAGLWSRLYEHLRCRAKHCKHGPHCLIDKQGNHIKILPAQLEEIIIYIKANNERRRNRGRCRC